MTQWKTMISGGTIGKRKIPSSRLYLYLLVAATFLNLLFPSFLLSSQITIDSKDQFAFARHLMEKKDYVRAILEFERLLYFFPGDEKVPEARYLIGVCHFRGGDYESARETAFGLYRDYPDHSIGGKALLLIGESYYAQGAFEEAERYFRMVTERFKDPDLRNRALYRLGWSRMKENRWDEASSLFDRVEPESPLYPSARELASKSIQGEELPVKNPVAAGLMAGLLPGLGHAYCGRYKDGTVAFLLNGLFVWAAYQAFEKDQEILGGILSFLEAGWYSGNIYSAVNCAHKHNRAVRDKFRNRLKDRFDLSLFTSGDKNLGIALTFDF
ncbi:MAG: tetratricopeptide repeat protein [Deltaproteobacteria bacterium]|nr:tetratricopeptide repeat protein [Deltaproteobacteria bacterium]